jgi:cytidylate kinase
VLLTQAQVKGEGVLGIQGDSGIGKTTIGRDVAAALGAPMYETSNGFRGFTVWALERGVDCADAEALARLARDFAFGMEDERVFVSGLDVTDKLRSHDTDFWVHEVAHVHAVRQAYVRAMLDWVVARPAVVVGRHLREVWPEAQLVINVERHDDVVRRAAEAEGQHAVAVLATRSAKDRETGERVLAHLAEPFYATLDTTGMDKQQQLAAALELARAHGF